MSTWSIGVFEAVQKDARRAIGERMDRRRGKKVFVVRFSFVDSEMDHAKVVWLDGPEPGAWFGPDDARWFAAAICHHRNAAVKFDRFDDAVAFWRRFDALSAEDAAQS